MGAILKSYFYRLFREKAFYIELSIVFGLCFTVALIVRLIMQGSGETLPGFSSLILTGLSGGTLFGGNSIPWLPMFFFIIFGAVRYRKETASGAMRNYVVSGYTRGQVYHALLLGNFVFYLCLVLAVTLGVCLPFLGAGWNLSGTVGDYLLSLGMIALMDVSFFLFSYFTFVLLMGHGFAGSMATLIYLGLSLIGVIGSVVIAASAETLGPEGVKNATLAISWSLPSCASAFASGNPSAVPFGSLFAAIIGTNPDYRAAFDAVDWRAYTVTFALIGSAIFGLGGYGFGLLAAVKRDLK